MSAVNILLFAVRMDHVTLAVCASKPVRPTKNPYVRQMERHLTTSVCLNKIFVAYRVTTHFTILAAARVRTCICVCVFFVFCFNGNMHYLSIYLFIYLFVCKICVLSIYTFLSLLFNTKFSFEDASKILLSGYDIERLFVSRS